MAKSKKSTGRKKKASTSKSTMKISGSTFTKKACSSKKTTASKSAEAIRKRGYKARVVKQSGGGYCVYQGPKRKRK